MVADDPSWVSRDPVGVPFDAVCICGHTAVNHWHGDRKKRVIYGRIENCSQCNRCTQFSVLPHRNAGQTNTTGEV